ncbi:MAG: DUF2953 domain-containing protein [Methanolinea sp.]|jgi:hypothetical protein|nr:DUF2953 domain-containing protein [Methanolinea sp.]
MDPHPVILVAAIILALVLLELCLYAIPLRVRVRMEYADGRGNALISVYWLCMGIRGQLSREHRVFNFLLGDVLIPTPAILETRVFDRHVKGGPGTPESEIHLVPNFVESVVPRIPDLISFLRSLIQSLSFRHLHCQAVVGLAGPAETGMLYGYFWALRSMLRHSGRIHLEMVPDFTSERLEGHLEMDVHVRYPFNLIARLVRLFTLFGGSKKAYT